MSDLFRPFFTYYGGKWRAAPRYPFPMHDTIVEPFAGAAGYSIRYANKKVILVEKNAKMASVWRYLIKVTSAEILALPLILPNQSVDDLNISQEARILIGLNCNQGSASPSKRLSKWANINPNSFWSEKFRQRVAKNVERIKHWTLIESNYSSAPDINATWFIDPPYNNKAGSYYPTQVGDYHALAAWCKSRKGQVMVCENEGADWLPFEPFLAIMANNGKNGGKISMEAIWTNAAKERNPSA